MGFRPIFSILLFIVSSSHLLAQSLVYEINITKRYPPISYGRLVEPVTSPQGITLDVNSHHFTKNGNPWFPIMGEFHYIRYPEKYWEEEIIKMKSGGLSIVATYIFWNAHENPKEAWDWSGIRNLRRFVELCQKHDMYVWLRIGPWSHGEQLHGGHPDWINNMKGKRSNDPVYLAESQKLFDQIGAQVQGLFFEDGGPIIGTQLENEYASGDPDHIGTLKKMALAAGIKPVYFTITANTVFHDEKREAIPLQGAYPYRGWVRDGGTATKDFLYANDQWIMTDALGKVYYDVSKYPKGLCEQGCGSQMKYKNRFTVEPHVVEAHLQNQIGRGMNLVGYYMFQGGTQLPGLKEPGYPESYDFQTSITEFGLLRPSYKYLKILHNFVHDFGSDLAASFVMAPENPVLDELNTDRLRYIARANGDSGFIFLNNTQVRVPMPDKQFKLQINIEQETITLPEGEMTLRGETNAILPFNYHLGDVLLKYATAQPMGRFSIGDEQVLIFTEVEGMDVELALDVATVKNIDAKDWGQSQKNGILYISPEGNIYEPILLYGNNGKKNRIIILTRDQAENSWRTSIGGQEYLLISKADVLVSKGQFEFRQLRENKITFDIFPAPSEILKVNGNPLQYENHGIFAHYHIDVRANEPLTDIERIDDKKARIMLPKSMPEGLSDLVLSLDYFGGSAIAKIDNHVVTDHLFHGSAWEFGLKRYITAGQKEILFELQDWSDDITGIPVEIVAEIKQNGTGWKEIKMIPQYSAIVTFAK